MHDVLIAGAGPTGLVLALWLSRLGVRVRIVDRTASPGATSRAIVVHARPLEFYAQLGIAERVVAHGIRVEEIRLNTRQRVVAKFPIGQIGQGLSPFPFVLALAQDEHERLLIDELRTVGVEVERNTELVSFTESEDGVRAVLRNDGATRDCESGWLCGCDGADSTVRRLIQAGFPGGTYDQLFFVADVRARDVTVSGTFNVYVAGTAFCIVLPVRQTGTIRLIGIVPPVHKDRAAITYDDVAAQVANATGLQVYDVNWFSTYHVHHRVADTFRRGRAFLLGDAGHIHSPAGGQGMNTGIGDAVNLAWKLAAVIQGRADPELLATYEIERIAFARWLVASTDRLFRLIASPSSANSLLRRLFIRAIAPALLNFRSVQHGLFRFVSQIEINYRTSPLSSGKAGRIHGGDRLPWVPGRDGDNFAPLQSLDWQLHVYGNAGDALGASARELRLPLHEFPFDHTAARTGLQKDALYLVRPDGHVALAQPTPNLAALRATIMKWTIQH